MNPYAEKLAEFLEDEVMFNAVKNILLAQFDLNALFQNKSDIPSSEIFELGRAYTEGRNILEKGFKEIEKNKRHEPRDGSDINPAV